jgi:hypothetical protein
MENNTNELIAGIVSVLAVIVTVITAVSASRNSAYNNLTSVVEQLRKDIERNDKKLAELEQSLERERGLRMSYEDYIHALIAQLTKHGIVPLDIGAFVEK